MKLFVPRGMLLLADNSYKYLDTWVFFDPVSVGWNACEYVRIADSAVRICEALVVRVSWSNADKDAISHKGASLVCKAHSYAFGRVGANVFLVNCGSMHLLAIGVGHRFEVHNLEIVAELGLEFALKIFWKFQK